ncbi:MAG: phospholipase D family protein [Planctomycetota bacterium]|jgi:putative cardiolipin synthase
MLKPSPGARAGLLAFIGGSLGCVAPLDLDAVERTPSSALPPARGVELAVVMGAEAPPSQSWFGPLDRPDEGLDARLALASVAQSSIDVQSYLWHADSSGSLLMDRLLDAADRGVRVRLMIDGFQLEDNLDVDVGIDSHPNIEVRVFNPTVHESGIWRGMEVLGTLERFDHRMHNKMFVVDGVAGVFGGRNIGDEYFGLGHEADFRDYDLLASGVVIDDLEAAFDDFWNCPYAIPVRALRPAGDEDSRAEALERAREAVAGRHLDDRRLDARRALTRADWSAALTHARAAMVPGAAELVHDLASVEDDGATGTMTSALSESLGPVEGDVLIVVAYLVPDEGFVENVRRHVAAGGRARILTNSYVSTNQPLAHAYYAAARDDLLDAGAELYEVRADAFSHAYHRSPGSRGQKLGLHAKSAVFGESRVVVGSMNLDPRSMVLNTEMGALIESRELAQRVRADLERDFAERNAWRVDRDEHGRIYWQSGEVKTYDEPQMSVREHVREWFVRLMPVQGEV